MNILNISLFISGISSKSHDEIISDIKNKFNKENK